MQTKAHILVVAEKISETQSEMQRLWKIAQKANPNLPQKEFIGTIDSVGWYATAITPQDRIPKHIDLLLMHYALPQKEKEKFIALLPKGAKKKMHYDYYA